MSLNPHAVNAGAADTTITTGAATIGAEITTAGRLILATHIKNTGAAALDMLALQVRAHSGGAWVDYLADAAFNTEGPRVLFCSAANPHTLAGGAQVQIHVNVMGAYAARWRATCGTTTTANRVGNSV